MAGRTDRAWQNGDDRSSTSSSCFGSSQRNKVRPLSPVSGDSHMVEVRPGRVLHIRHINARPRDTRFEKEMNMQRMYKSQGLQTSSGPLSMPKKKVTMKAVTRTDAHTPTALPNSVHPHGLMNDDGPQGKPAGSEGELASPPSGDQQRAINTSGDQQRAFNTSGDQQRAFNTSGDQQRAFSTSGDQQRAFSTSGDQQRAINTSGDQQRAISTSGDQQRVINTSGDQQRAFNTSGDQQRAINTSGDQQRAFNTSGDQQRAINTSGDQQRAINTSGDQQRAINTSGDQQRAFSTSGDQQRAINTSGDQQRAFNTSGDQQRAFNTSGNKPHSAASADQRQVSASGSKTEFTSPSSVLVDLQTSAISEDGVSLPDPINIPEKITEKSQVTSDATVNMSLNNTASGIAVDDDNVHRDAAMNTSVNLNDNETASDNNPTNTCKNSSEDKPLQHHTLQPASENQDNKENSVLSESELATLYTTSADVTATSEPMGNNLFGQMESQTPKASPAHNGVARPATKNPTTVLFFFHGVGGSSSVWAAQMKYFAKQGYEIVAPDLIGHGLSCAPKNASAYHFTEIAADSEEIFDKFCKKRNVVIGHSYGCSFAVVLARRRSRRVHKLVLVSGGAPTPLAPQPGIFTLPTRVLGCVRPCLNCGFHKNAFHRDRDPVIDKGEAFSIPTYVLQNTMNGQDWTDGDELYHQWLLCPTLLLYGAQDKLVTLKEEEHMEEVIYRSRLEIIHDASHMVMIEAPDEVCQILHTFLTEDSTLCTKANSPQPPPPPVQPEPIHSPMRPVSRMSLKSTKSYKAHFI